MSTCIVCVMLSGDVHSFISLQLAFIYRFNYANSNVCTQERQRVTLFLMDLRLLGLF